VLYAHPGREAAFGACGDGDRHDRGVPHGSQTTAPAIVALGLRADSLLPGQSPPYSLVEPLERGDSAELIARLDAVLEESGHVIVVDPTWFAPPARLRIEMADLILDRPRLAIYDTALPPLAAGVLASIAAAVAAHLPSPGALVAALPALERQLLWFGWLRSVSGLNEPRPRLTQHASSYLPWTRFVVSSHPEPAVQRVPRREAGLAVPPLGPGHALVYAAWTDDEAWVDDVLARAVGLDARMLEPSPHAPVWWGTEQIVEAVVHPLDMAGLGARLAAKLQLRPCAWCDELVASSPCPFCGFAARSQAAAAG
jgi:hypothetical protein